MQELTREQKVKTNDIRLAMEDIVASSEQSTAGAEESAAGAEEQVQAMGQVLNLIKNLEEMALELNNTFTSYSDALVLKEEQKAKIEKVKVLARDMIREPAFANNDYIEVERLLKETIEREDGIELFVYSDTQGIVKSTTLEEIRNIDIEHRDYFQEAMKGDIYVSRPYVSSATYNFCVSISIPVKDSSGEIKGMLLADADISE